MKPRASGTESRNLWARRVGDNGNHGSTPGILPLPQLSLVSPVLLAPPFSCSRAGGSPGFQGTAVVAPPIGPRPVAAPPGQPQSGR
jgi:hypothetical protein